MEDTIRYTSVHNHTDFSNLIGFPDSINRVEDVLDYANELKMKAIAITDHGIISSHVRAKQHKDKMETDMKLILGSEFYLTREGVSADDYQAGENFFHLVVLAKNKKGYDELKRLTSVSHLRGFYKYVKRNPLYFSDFEDTSNLIATSACLGGVLGKAFISYQQTKDIFFRELIEHMADKFKDQFGADYYLEIQPSNDPTQIEYNKYLIELGKEKDIKVIVATDSHYLKKEDAKIHTIYLRSKEETTGDREVEGFYESAYLMSAEEIIERLGYIPREEVLTILENTNEIADKIEEFDIKAPQVIPQVRNELTNYQKEILSYDYSKFPYISQFISSEYNGDVVYISKVLEGLYTQIEPINYKKYLDRVEIEVAEVWEISLRLDIHLSDYFLSCAKIVELMWSEGDSIVGVSRGSAGSFVSNKFLGITQMDPISGGIEVPHWRFVHRDRPELPDIDVDAESLKKEICFNAIQKYFQEDGGDAVRVAAFGTEGPSSAVRTACRGLGIDEEVAGYIASMIPVERGFPWSLKDCYLGNPEKERGRIGNFVQEVDRWPMLKETMFKIEGLIRNGTSHAAGVLCVNSDFWERNAYMRLNSGEIVSQFDLGDSEYLGGIKYDLLITSALSKIRQALSLLEKAGYLEPMPIKQQYEKYIGLDKIPLDNQDMWRYLNNHEILDLFQFYSAVGKTALEEAKPTSLAELGSANSIMRLAPEKGEEKPLTTLKRFKEQPILWENEMISAGLTKEERDLMRKHLKDFHGIADTQESVMLLVMDPGICNFSVSEANKLRKAIAKKSEAYMKEVRELFYEKGQEAGTSKNLLNYIWDRQIKRQLGYSFSLPHVAGYSLIAIQQLYLTWNWPSIYWNCACLAVNADTVEADDDGDDSGSANYTKIAVSVDAIRRAGVDIRTPNINKSQYDFVPDELDNCIHFGLRGVTSIKKSHIDEILTRRPFTDFDDFLTRVEMTNKQIINLIKANAFQEFKERRVLLKDYLLTLAEPKKKLTLSNLSMLRKAGLLAELEEDFRLYDILIKKTTLTMADIDFINTIDPDIVLYKGNEASISPAFKVNSTTLYKEKFKNYIKQHHNKLLPELNEILFMDTVAKYAPGSPAKWYMDSLSYYPEEHDLHYLPTQHPIKLFTDLDPEGVIINSFTNRQGRQVMIYGVDLIAGTVIGKVKASKTVILLTETGVVNVKVNNFADYNRQITVDGTREKGWFSRGNILIVQGRRSGDIFRAMTPKRHSMLPKSVALLHNDNQTGISYYRLGEYVEDFTNR